MIVTLSLQNNCHTGFTHGCLGGLGRKILHQRLAFISTVWDPSSLLWGTLGSNGYKMALLA